MASAHPVPCQNSMHSLGPGVSLAELGSLLKFVDHVSEESMTPIGVSSRVTTVGPWGGAEACRLAVWRWGGRRSGYRQEPVLGQIVLV
jgi:hypothetical protein